MANLKRVPINLVFSAHHRRPPSPCTTSSIPCWCNPAMPSTCARRTSPETAVQAFPTAFIIGSIAYSAQNTFSDQSNSFHQRHFCRKQQQQRAPQEGVIADTRTCFCGMCVVYKPEILREKNNIQPPKYVCSRFSSEQQQSTQNGGKRQTS